MYAQTSWRKIKAVLKSIKNGATIHAACHAANVPISTFWFWRKRDRRLDAMVKAMYESRIAVVEDRLYKEAREGNVSAMIFFLKNRARDRWRDRMDFEHGANEELLAQFAGRTNEDLEQRALEIARGIVSNPSRS